MLKVEQILKQVENKGFAVLEEDCNCGLQIRHNNGGNYHQNVEYSKGTEPNEYYEQWDDSCELDGPNEPRQISYQEMRESIARSLEQGLH